PLRSRPSLFSLLGQTPSARSQLSGLLGEPPGTRRFLNLIANGRLVAKWQYWMAVEDPPTDLLDATVPIPGRPALAAGSAGLLQSDRQQGSWLRTAGAPQPRGEGLVVYAVTVDPEDPTHVFAGSARGILVSRDGGTSFAPHADPELAELSVRRFYW